MVKPSVSKSKKGAIFNILWLLIENPKKFEYFRIVDIKNLLFEEFSIDLDRKTIQDYVDILIELNLPFKISHKHKHGYYVSKRMLSDTERDILINSLYGQKAINLDTKINIFNYITFDCEKRKRNEIFINNDKCNSTMDSHYNLVENLEIIQRAIDEKRSITFEYLNYNHFGELMSDGRCYKVIPQRIKYIYGMYYLYNADNFWSNIYCGTKIKYMRNIKLGEYHNNPKLHEKFDYSFEVGVLYDWSIELIVDHFDDFKLVRDKNKMTAIINTPYEYALEWCKKYAQFFAINDEEIKEAIRSDMSNLLANIDEKDELLHKIKAAIVDYHYKNPVNNTSIYEKYMHGLYKYIDFYLNNMCYKKINDSNMNVYTNGNDNINIIYLECCESNKDYNNNILTIVENAYNQLNKVKDNKRIMVIFYDELSKYQISKIEKILKVNNLINIHDRFSNCNKAFFYKYIVVEL